MKGNDGVISISVSALNDPCDTALNQLKKRLQ